MTKIKQEFMVKEEAGGDIEWMIKKEAGEIAGARIGVNHDYFAAAARLARAAKNVEQFAMANCSALETAKPDDSGRVFTCKTCNRDFTSFQALGGHRASHKRIPRIIVTAIAGEDIGVVRVDTGFKSRRLHKCSICGLEFAMGQALGGHMRRHRADEQWAAVGSGSDCTSETTSLDAPAVAPEIRATSPPYHRDQRAMLDLNLTPYENYMKFFD